MSPLLEALVAASKVGFDAPKCEDCEGARGFKSSCYHDNFRPCLKCHATGLDASDPDRLIGRAMGWLHGRALTVQAAPTWATHQKAGEGENHDGTPTDLASAMLRLVARTGGAA